MAIAFVSETHTEGNFTTGVQAPYTNVIAHPAGVSGDVMLLAVATDNAYSIDTPSGWTLVVSGTSGGQGSSATRITVFKRTWASGSTTVTSTFGSIAAQAVILCYRGVDTSTIVKGTSVADGPTGSTPQAQPPNISDAGDIAVRFFAMWQANDRRFSGSVNLGTTRTNSAVGTGSQWSPQMLASDDTSLGSTVSATLSGTSNYDWQATAVSLDELPNSPPTAPTLNSPSSGGMIDPGVVNRFSWTFNDPDGGSQGTYELQIHDLSGNIQYQSGEITSTNQFHDVPANALPTERTNAQWRVVTKDPLGASGPYSTYRPLVIRRKVHGWGVGI